MHYPEQYLGWMMTIDETDVTMEWHDYPNPGDSDGDGFGGGGSDGGGGFGGGGSDGGRF